jgi:flagellar basal-body rod protein FlgF
MIRGLYSSAGALQMAERNQEVIAHNLANAGMPGFRRQLVAFESSDQLDPPHGTHPAHASEIGAPGPNVITVFEPGAIQHTQRSLDFALKGDGFFTVEGPDGPLYTRNGAFEMGIDGTLQTGGGLPVSGTTGRLTIPPGTVEIVVQEDGAVLADGAQVGQMRIVSFDDKRQLVEAGTTLYEAPKGVVPGAARSTVHQYHREGSNVQVVDEMVRMIAGMRMYEASQRAMKSISDAMEQRTTGQLP